MVATMRVTVCGLYVRMETKEGGLVTNMLGVGWDFKAWRGTKNYRRQREELYGSLTQGMVKPIQLIIVKKLQYIVVANQQLDL